MVSEGIPTQVDIPIQKKRNAHPEVAKDRQIEKEKDAMMNTQEDQTKNRDLWQFEFQQKVSSSHLIDAHHLSQLSKKGLIFICV